jgi:hypothetical protein
MAVNVTKPAISLREELSKVSKWADQAGDADTVSGRNATTLMSGRKNYIINGDFRIWQRGTSFATATNEYTADRWKSDANGNYVLKVTESDGSNWLRMYKSTATDAFQSVKTTLELPQKMGGKTFTLSGRVSFNVSSPASYLYITWRNAASNAEGTAFNILWASIGVDNTLTGEVQEFSFTFTLPNNATTWYGFDIRVVGNGNTGTVNYDLQFTDIQLEVGSIATDFEYRPIGEELALCQRYYEKSKQLDNFAAGGVGVQSVLAVGTSSTTNTNAARITVPYKVRKRVTPTVTTENGTTGVANEFREIAAGGAISSSISSQSEASFAVFNTINVIDARTYTFHWTADAEL